MIVGRSRHPVPQIFEFTTLLILLKWELGTFSYLLKWLYLRETLTQLLEDLKGVEAVSAYMSTPSAELNPLLVFVLK